MNVLVIDMCEVIDPAGRCVKCARDHYNHNKWCIYGCVEADPLYQTTIKCVKCAPGFFLD